MERILFLMKFPAEIWKNIEYEIREISQSILEPNCRIRLLTL